MLKASDYKICKINHSLKKRCSEKACADSTYFDFYRRKMPATNVSVTASTKSLPFPGDRGIVKL
jgi:hypothetical protein